MESFGSSIEISVVITSLLLLLYISHFKDVFNTTTVTASSDNIANSPSFPNQEILDNRTDWIDLKTRSFTKARSYYRYRIS